MKMHELLCTTLSFYDPLPDNNILALSKLEAFADDKFNINSKKC